MKDFKKFPWRYIHAVLESREFFFEAAMEFTKQEFADHAAPCPGCSKSPMDLAWLPVDTADETWARGEGRSGFVTCCMQCRQQVDFFVDDDLTRLEADLRADGKSSQSLPWSESECARDGQAGSAG